MRSRGSFSTLLFTKFHPYGNLSEKSDPTDRHFVHLSPTNENLWRGIASISRKAKAYLPLRLTIWNMHRELQRAFCPTSLQLQAKPWRHTLYDPLFPVSRERECTSVNNLAPNCPFYGYASPWKSEQGRLPPILRSFLPISSENALLHRSMLLRFRERGDKNDRIHKELVRLVRQISRNSSAVFLHCTQSPAKRRVPRTRLADPTS